MTVSVNDPLPHVTVYTVQAEPRRLCELPGGKPTVLLFFPAAHTRVCERELCTFRDSLAQYNDLGVQVFGLSVDTPWTLGLEISLHGLPGFSQRAAYVVGADNRIAWAWVANVPSQEPPYEEIAAAVQKLG
jgi:peroxiredoxin